MVSGNETFFFTSVRTKLHLSLQFLVEVESHQEWRSKHYKSDLMKKRNEKAGVAVI